ncbi:hypothetical protein Tco_1545843 [Tanacetum coccineum]
MVKTGLVEAIDSLVPLDEHFATFRGMDIQEKDKKKAKNKQNQARNGKDKVKSKPKTAYSAYLLPIFAYLCFYHDVEVAHLQKVHGKETLMKYNVSNNSEVIEASLQSKQEAAMNERVDERMLRWTLNEEDNVIDIGLEVLIGIPNYLYLYDVRPSENDLIEHTCKAILATFSMVVWTWRHFYWIYWKTRVVVILPQRMLLWTMWVTPLLGTIYGPSDQHALMKTLCIHRASFGSEQNTTLNTQCARSLGSSSLCQTDFLGPQNVVRFPERETTSLEIPIIREVFMKLLLKSLGSKQQWIVSSERDRLITVDYG